MIRTRPLALAVVASAALTVLVGCSNTPAPADTDTSVAAEAPASDSGSFCDEYSAAGGTLVTPTNFQVGMPAEQTIADIGGRVEIFDAVTPPAEITTEWTTLRDLYAETVTIAEQLPAGSSVVDARVFDILREIEAPSDVVSAYLDEKC